MIRKIQRSVLVIIVVLGLSAVSATSASGEYFHSEASHTLWLAQQDAESEDVYTFNAGTAGCRSITYAGTNESQTSSEALRLFPTFSECTAFGFVNAVIHSNGCEYQYKPNKKGEPSTGRLALVCPAGKAIVITAFNCHVTIPPQAELGSVTYTTQGSGKSRHIKISPSITGIQYTQSNKSFPGCSGSNGTFSNGTYVGTTTLQGRNTVEEQVGVFVEDPPPAKAEVHSEAAHTLWSASQVGEDAYSFDSGSWKCSTRTYAGTATAATGTTIELTPSFSSCPGVTAVDVNGCSYRYHTREKGSSNLDMSIACPEGKSIVVTAPNCHVTIPAQTGLSAVTYENQGSNKTQDVKISHSITGLKYSQEPKNFPGCTKNSFANGTYSGVTTLKGTNTASEQIGVAIGEIDPPGDEFHSEAAHALWSGAQIGEDSYTFTGGTWKCSSRSYTGTSTVATDTTISLIPSFAGCIESTTVDTNGCEYRYHTAKEGVSSQGMSIVCPAGKSIMITASTCHLTIPAQSGLTGVTYANEGAGKSRDIKISHSITGLKYSQEPKNFPGCTKGSFTDGTYSGATTLKATNTASEQIGIWVK